MRKRNYDKPVPTYVGPIIREYILANGNRVQERRAILHGKEVTLKITRRSDQDLDSCRIPGYELLVP